MPRVQEIPRPPLISLPTLLFYLLAAAVGLLIFFSTAGFEEAHQQRLAAIRDGKAMPLELTLVEKLQQERNPADDESDYDYLLRFRSGGGLIEQRNVSENEWNQYAVGARFQGWLVEEEIVIPETDKGGFEVGRWFFLTVCLLPGALGLLIALWRRWRMGSQRP